MRLFMRGTSPILVTAALSIAGLVAAIGMYAGNMSGAERVVVDMTRLEPVAAKKYLPVADADGNGTPDWRDELGTTTVATASSTQPEEDPLVHMSDSVASALYGGYLSLKQYGTYTNSQGTALAFNVAENIRAPLLEKPFTVDDITIRENSVAASQEYRTEMQTALAPMVTDDPPELEYFAQYLTSKDPAWLPKLSEAADRYRAARDNMKAVAAPQAAVPEHLRALNALGAYAETLDRLAQYAHDTFASIALLKTMNESEEEMLTAFDALAKYYVRTLAQN